MSLELFEKAIHKLTSIELNLTELTNVFGSAATPQKIKEFQAQYQARDADVIPKLEIRPASSLNGASGAYALSSNTIFLSAEFVATANDQEIEKVLLEELGHSLDKFFNGVVDSPGDEGELFSALVRNVPLSQDQVMHIQSEDDTAMITIDGELVAIEQASISDSGGQGGTTKTLKLEPLSPVQLKKNVTLNYFYEHFSVPDEFELRYGGKVIFGTGGLVSGNKRGQVSFEQINGNDSVEVNVTAPQSGTAWNFSVDNESKQINVDAKLGDITKINFGKEGSPFTLKSVPTFPKARLIDDKGESAVVDTEYKALFLIPTVSGSIQNYGKDRTGDLGLGQLTFDAEDQDKKSITVNVTVADGFSTSGDNKVTTGKDKLDVYRQQQRLAYLGFPGSSGNPLTIDGSFDSNTVWAKKLFNIAVNPKIASARGRIASQDDKSFNGFINSSNAPEWNLLKGNISGLNIDSQQFSRNFGTDLTGDFLRRAAISQSLTSTGISQKSGIGNPSSTHDGGRSIDIDNIPGPYFFNIRGVGGKRYVAAPGGKIVINDGGTYKAGDPGIPTDVAKGVLVDTLTAKTGNTRAEVSAIHAAGLFVFSQTIADVQSLLSAFSGSPIIFYNDPRFFGTGVIQFQQVHFDHIHFEIPVPSGAAQSQSQSLSNQFSNALFFASQPPVVSNTFLDLTELGFLTDNKNVSGTVTGIASEKYYSFTIGNPGDSDEDAYFTTPRDFNLLLNGLSNDLDVEMFQDFDEDGTRQEGEVLASSKTLGTVSESINLTNLDEGLYFLRVFSKGGASNFNLNLSVPPLPIPTDNAGNTVTNAKNLGIIGANNQQTDFIGQVDPNDYYRFSLSTTSDLKVDLIGLLKGDPFIEFGQDRNNNGILDFDEIIEFTDQESNISENITLTGLAAGEYILHLGRNSGNTNYTLNLSATPSVIPSDKAGSNLATAFNLNTLSASTQNDFVGNVDSTDYYRFNITNPSGVTFSLSGLSGDADLELSQDKNGDGRISSDEIIQVSENTNIQNENITIAALPVGTYFIKVVQYEGDTNYSLAISPQVATGVDLQVSVTPITTSLTLGDNVSYTVTVKNIGASNAIGVVLKDNFPTENVLDVTANPSKGTKVISDSQIVANIGNLSVNESATVVIAGRLIGSGSVSSLIEASSTVTDYNPDDNSVVQRFSVAVGEIKPADLELKLTSNKTNGAVGEQVNFQLEIDNKGPGAATSIQVKNLLPQSLSYISSSGQGSYDPVTGIWSAGNIASNNGATLNIIANIASGGAIDSIAEILSVAETDPDSTPGNGVIGEDDIASVSIISGNTPGVISRPTAGGNLILGTNGANTISGNSPNTTAVNDTIAGFAGDDRIFGLTGNDSIDGGFGGDSLFGGIGSDTLIGNIGDDILTGTDFGSTTDVDRLIGGVGADRFVLGNSSGNFYLGASDYALISDFESADKIQVQTPANIVFGVLPLPSGILSGTTLGAGGNLIGVVQGTVPTLASLVTSIV